MKHPHLSLALIFTCIVSCTSERKDQAQATANASLASKEGPAETILSCSDYTADECKLNESCHIIRGFDLETEKVEFIGCVENNIDGGIACNQAISCFTNSDKSRNVILTNGCHPSDWTITECSEDNQKSLDDFFSQGGSF